MSNDPNPATSDALEDAAYLARSENRVRILEALSTASYTRRDLVDVTDVSSATVGRILKELQSREWAERTRDGYVATPTGKRVTHEFKPFIGAMEAIQHLGEAVDWIPADELSIGLHHFGDATVRRPERYDPAEVSDFFIELLRDVATFRALTHLVPIEAKEKTLLDGVQNGRLNAQVVLTAGLLDYLCDHPNHQHLWEELIEAGVGMYRYDAPIPCNLFILDDIVMLGNSHSDSGHPYACIVSENPTVRSWAHELFDRYRAEAQRIDARVIAKGVSVQVEQSPDGERRRSSRTGSVSSGCPHREDIFIA